MSLPRTPEEWIKIAKLFEERWQFLNCFASVDGKHIALFKPYGSGSNFWNYKNFFSIVLMALVDIDYKFIYVDIGCQGRLSDGAVMCNTTLTELLKAEELALLGDRLLPDLANLDGSANDSFLDGERLDTPLPYVMVADEAFALTRHCMKPYAQKGLTDGKRIFNYRLSRAHMRLAS